MHYANSPACMFSLQPVPDSLTMKRAKGKKKEQTTQPDLSRIYGWYSDSDEGGVDLAATNDPGATAVGLLWLVHAGMATRTSH